MSRVRFRLHFDRALNGLCHRVLVAWVMLLDTFHTAASVYMLWDYVVTNFNNPAFLSAAPWPFPSTPIVTALYVPRPLSSVATADSSCLQCICSNPNFPCLAHQAILRLLVVVRDDRHILFRAGRHGLRERDRCAVEPEVSRLPILLDCRPDIVGLLACLVSMRLRRSYLSSIAGFLWRCSLTSVSRTSALASHSVL